MKIFLLGHKGFIGSHLLTKLQSLGHEVSTDMGYWNERYEVIINLAAVTHIRNEFDPKMIESNIILMNEVFKRPERIIYASSCSAAHFTNPYAWTKQWAEYLGNKHGNSIGLRLHNVYGPGNNKGIVWFLNNCIDGQSIQVRGPELVRDYIYVDDVVNFILGQLNPMSLYINIEALRNAIPEGIKVDEAIKLALEQNIFFGTEKYVNGEKRSGVIDVGTGTGLQTMDVVNLYMRLSGKTFDITCTEAGDNEPKEMVSNNSVPHISLEEGLKKMIHG